MTTILYFFLPAIFGTAINKDFATQTHQVLYSYPFSKFQYLLGKFLSALVVALRFNGGRPPRVSYSALDGYGHRLSSFYAFSVYWILCSLVFLFT